MLGQSHTMAFVGNVVANSFCLENIKIEHAADGKSHIAGFVTQWTTVFRRPFFGNHQQFQKRFPIEDQTDVHIDHPLPTADSGQENAWDKELMALSQFLGLVEGEYPNMKKRVAQWMDNVGASSLSEVKLGLSCSDSFMPVCKKEYRVGFPSTPEVVESYWD